MGWNLICLIISPSVFTRFLLKFNVINAMIVRYKKNVCPLGSYNPDVNRNSNGLSLNVKLQRYRSTKNENYSWNISPHCKSTHGPNVIICVCALCIPVQTCFSCIILKTNNSNKQLGCKNQSVANCMKTNTNTKTTQIISICLGVTTFMTDSC